MQCADGRRGLPLGARFQPLAQQHQRDHHRRGFKVQVRRDIGGDTEPQPYRQRPTRAGADGDQQIHIAAQRARSVPARLVKARTQIKLHRSSQSKLQPGGQHPVQTERVAQHRQHQWQRQGRTERHRTKTSPGGFCRRINGGVGSDRLVACIAHCALQSGFNLLGRVDQNAR